MDEQTTGRGAESEAAGNWNVERARDLYGLAEWGAGAFDVGPNGHLLCRPRGEKGPAVDLFELVSGLAERGVETPILLRFDDLLAHRLEVLREAFERARREVGYRGGYRCVYPVKVNPQRHVCEKILEHAPRLGFGFEVGSKPELLAVLALTADAPDVPIVCNGFKDAEYLEFVVLAHKLGRDITTVVERFVELELLLHNARRLGVEPKVGLRAKLSTRGSGRWEESGGPRSKFGLTVSEILEAADLLRREGRLDSLRMVHAHLGSQVPDIRRFKNAVTELARLYVELRRLGAPVEAIDVGGGLGIDYEGSRQTTQSSVNYTIDEYALDVLYRIRNVCNEAGEQHPLVITESGRWIVAPTSVLVVDELGRARFDADPDVARLRSRLAERPAEQRPQPLLDLLDAWEELARGSSLSQVYHDALQAREEAMSLFALGHLSLPLRAEADRLFWAIGRGLADRVRRDPGLLESHPELEELPHMLSDICFCNFSIFQSCPDSWAIGQVFPVVPLHRLDEPPTRETVLADVTCDSDGKIDTFPTRSGSRRTLPVHETRSGERYLLGVFLVGAYQEVLGDLHNLYGDTNVVHVALDEEGGYTLSEVIEGDTVREVLGYVQYDPDSLLRAIRRDAERAVRRGALSTREAGLLTRAFEAGLRGSTYLEEGVTPVEQAGSRAAPKEAAVE